MIQIVPAIDLIGGKCVRLSQGLFENVKEYEYTPLQIAKMYEQAGLDYLHLVDLDGAKSSMLCNVHILKEIAENTNLKIDSGGGIKTSEDAAILFDAGADAINLGSLAVKTPDLFIQLLSKFGSDKIILSADVDGEKIKIFGWQQDTDFTIFDLVDKFLPYGLKKVCVTAIQCDGMLTGPDFVLYEKLRTKYPDIYIIASGGVSCMDDLYRLDKMNIDAVIIGKAIYEKRISINELSNFKKRC